MKDKVNKLLDHFENIELNGATATAYNYLIDYDEDLFSSNLEASRLFTLCAEILEEHINK